MRRRGIGMPVKAERSRAALRSCDSRFPIPDSRGFTLIEILVVTVILAISAVAVTLAIAGAGGERQLARDAERLHALLGYACEQAERSGHPIGISLTSEGYRFSRNENAAWLPERDGELRPRKWSVQAGATLTRSGQRVEIGKEFPDKPQLVCFSSGELTPFRLDLALPESATRFRLEGRQDGEVIQSSEGNRAR
jgi:general secretion pathway protein H